MLHVERVAAAGVIHVVARIVVHETVVRRVVDAAKAQRRPEVIALRRVVVDDVEDHFEAGGMQRLHHRLELAFGARGRRVVLMRGEVADRVVAPEVAQTLLDEMPVVHEVVHRHQLHRRDAEALQIVDDRRGGESRVRAAILRRHIGMLHREAAHVHLVDDRVVPRRTRTAVIAPGERRIDHLALRHAQRVVAPVERQIASLTADAIAEVRVGPRQRTDDRFRVGIEHKLVRD